jgi:hypothetical protein
LGSLPPFAAFTHETNAKPEGEWRQCGQTTAYQLLESSTDAAKKLNGCQKRRVRALSKVYLFPERARTASSPEKKWGWFVEWQLQFCQVCFDF